MTRGLNVKVRVSQECVCAAARGEDHEGQDLKERVREAVLCARQPPVIRWRPVIGPGFQLLSTTPSSTPPYQTRCQ